MAGYLVEDNKKITTQRLIEMKKEGKKIAMLTSYDYTMARIVDQAGMDVILIGDSASNVMAGNATTLPITIDEMIYHGRCVARAVKRALVVLDMPFGTYQASRDEAVKNACRMMAESGADALKLEGGVHIVDTIRAIVNAGVPVMGHLGLTPQSVNKFGGYGLRAKENAEAEQLLKDAQLLEDAGCFSIVTEKIPAQLNQKVCNLLTIPVVGIGAGASDGQVLVAHDMLGLNTGFKPKFLRQYANLADVMNDALGAYITDVKSGDFPNEKESY